MVVPLSCTGKRREKVSLSTFHHFLRGVQPFHLEENLKAFQLDWQSGLMIVVFPGVDSCAQH
jgi:hypothetical protein